MNLTRSFALLLLALALLPLGHLDAAAQIPADQYLRYMPLGYPRIIRQTEASARFHLYGNPADPTYRDEDPRDGIDDARGRRLSAMAVRFAPLMVRNTPQFPMDFRTFFERESFPLYVGRWDVARHNFAAVGSEQVDLATLRDAPCPAPGTPGNDDCRLIEILERYGPNRPPLEPEATARAEQEIVTVLHLDMPGYNERTWKAEYWPLHAGPKRPELVGTERVFTHPFVAEYPGDNGAQPTYELVIQYWFFYPANDGPNNHEGDWEHINVVVSPRSAVTRRFDAGEVEALLSGQMPLDGADPVVLKRIEYYLHHFVYPMDFSAPNVYQPRADWWREVQALAREAERGTKLWERVRERAYRDEAESVINTQPVVWIGGDAVGFQNVMETPGLKDQDGHPSYPFRGYYKKIGPGGVGERAIQAFDHFEYFAGTSEDVDYVDDYARAERIALMPDWERVIDLSMTDAGVRREWGWMLLPMRFGYPASPSPGAGLIAHADMGNVAPIGPTYNDAWNRVGDSAGYATYEMVEQSWAAPLGGQDSFFPRAGFLNAPILYFMLKPPLDLVWRTIALPVRAAVGSRQPTFLPANAPSVRNFSVEVGPMLTNLPEDLVSLFFARDQFPEIFGAIGQNIPETGVSELSIVPKFGWTSAPAYSLAFHLTPRMSTESSITNYKASIGFDFTAPELAQPIRTRADFQQFDYHGTLRFNFLTGRFQPYAKYGHGITWYRLKNITVNGQRIPNATSPLFKPDGKWWDLGFNETVIGGGVDWNDIKIGRMWLGVKANYSAMYHDIGFEQLAAVEEFPQLATLTAGTKYALWRQQFRLLLSFSF